MKRTMAFLAAICVSAGVFTAPAALAQQPPTPAPADTVKAGGDSPTAPVSPTQPTTAPATTAPDTAAAAGARARRARAADDRLGYVVSLAIGEAINYKPESFADHFDPLFGLMFSVGARRYGITVAGTFDYNFFLASGSEPNDLNILNMFVDMKYMPVHSTARPYLVLCGGYFRQWIVDTDYTEGVLGYGGGVGVELEIDRVRRLFLEARYVQGQTRETEQKANTELIPIRLGVTWEIR